MLVLRASLKVSLIHTSAQAFFLDTALVQGLIPPRGVHDPPRPEPLGPHAGRHVVILRGRVVDHPLEDLPGRWPTDLRATWRSGKGRATKLTAAPRAFSFAKSPRYLGAPRLRPRASGVTPGPLISRSSQCSCAFVSAKALKTSMASASLQERGGYHQERGIEKSIEMTTMAKRSCLIDFNYS